MFDVRYFWDIRRPVCCAWTWLARNISVSDNRDVWDKCKQIGSSIIFFESKEIGWFSLEVHGRTRNHMFGSSSWESSFVSQRSSNQKQESNRFIDIHYIHVWHHV